jgi:hypothetical protein
VGDKLWRLYGLLLFFFYCSPLKGICRKKFPTAKSAAKCRPWLYFRQKHLPKVCLVRVWKVAIAEFVCLAHLHARCNRHLLDFIGYLKNKLLLLCGYICCVSCKLKFDYRNVLNCIFIWVLAVTSITCKHFVLVNAVTGCLNGNVVIF